jgi:hypothetical protein
MGTIVEEAHMKAKVVSEEANIVDIREIQSPRYFHLPMTCTEVHEIFIALFIQPFP